MSESCVEWIVFYHDGSSFASDEGGPEDAPRVGVQVIAISDPDVGRELVWRHDYYCWHEGQWIGHDQDGMRTYMQTVAKWPIVLFGFEIDKKRFHTVIHRQAYNDPRLPRKFAFHHHEPRLGED